MPCILSYFHNIIGPDILYKTEPVEKYADQEVNNIIKLLDTAEEGFFIYNMPSLKTANYYFTVPSPWARGRKEMLMVSVILQEQDADLKHYEEILNRWVRGVSQIPEVYKACYFHNPPDGETDAILAKKEALAEEVRELSKQFSIERPKTWGMLIENEALKREPVVRLPKNLMKDFFSLSEDTEKNAFFVYRKRADAVKIDLIPVSGNTVLKISIYFVEMGPEVLRALVKIFNELKLKVIFTSGMCQDEEHCVYEVYIDPSNLRSYDPVVNRVMQLKFNQDMKIKRIHLINIGF